MLRRRIAACISVWMTITLLLAMVSAAPCFASGIVSMTAKAAQTDQAGLHGCCEHAASVKPADCCGSFAPVPATAADVAPSTAVFLQVVTYSSIELVPQVSDSSEIPSSAQTSRRIPATILRT